MEYDFPDNRLRRTHALREGRGAVIDLAARRGQRDYIESITLMFDGVHYGTFAVRMPYAKNTPVVLYVVPSAAEANESEASDAFSCLITNDPSLAIANDLAR